MGVRSTVWFCRRCQTVLSICDTATEDDMKTCNKCGETKELNMFYKLSTSPDGHNKSCRICMQAYSRNIREKNRTSNETRELNLELAATTFKLCSGCNTEKSLLMFGSAPNRKEGRHTWCKVCLKDRVWEYKIKNIYNITIDFYLDLLDKQDGKCAICQSPPLKKRLAIDHDHTCCDGDSSCGKCIRGLLCASCNTGLGYAQDSVSILESMIVYLKATDAAVVRL